MWIFGFYITFILLTTVSALNFPHKKEDRYNYLNKKNPLWILDDRVSSKERDSISLNKIETSGKLRSAKYFYPKHHSRALFSPVDRYPKRIDLPKNYIYLGRYNYTRYDARKSNMRRTQPIFIPVSKQYTIRRYSLAPNEDILGPIFMFSDPQGELILNAFLGKKPLSLSEAFPGEIVNPPTAPLFHPRRIIQRYPVPGHESPTNLTLIPFYAHEAIIPRFLSEATDKGTTVLYAAQDSPRRTTTTERPTKKRRFKNMKHYTVYRSPDEVHWYPTEKASVGFSDPTTPQPMVLASPLENHRYSEALDSTVEPPKNFKLSFKDEESEFQIIYVDESLERPVSREATPTGSPRTHLDPSSGIKYSKPLPLLSSHYVGSKKYYAFPVFTLGKLLKADTGLGSSGRSSSPSISKPNETWFILNSRYKGPIVGDGSHRLSSKYIEVPRVTKERARDESAETAIEQTLLL